MTRDKPGSSIATAYCVHDDWYYLADSIASVKQLGPVMVFVSRVPWHAEPGDWARCAEIAHSAGAEVCEGDWSSESLHRSYALGEARRRGVTFLLTVDGDEIVEPSLGKALSAVAKANLADVVEVEMQTYWRSPEYAIRPPESLTPVLMVRADAAEHHHIRNYSGKRRVRLGAGIGSLHHLSYCGPDERILRKLETWSHRDEVVSGWWTKKWQAWKTDHTVRNLHPTHPECYLFTERIRCPAVLEPCMDKEWDLPRTALQSFFTGSEGRADTDPKVSVCIPLCGGEDDIVRCLDSLESCRDLLHETIVVDNASPDGSNALVRQRDWVHLIENEQNLGFARASNQAANAATGNVLLFLNSDTIVTRPGIREMIKDLMSSGSVAATGPVSNNVGHNQQIDPTYTSLETIELFAEDLAATAKRARDVDMLVGFCLAVKRSVFEEVGPFDESFGLGFFEDNDLCYRMRRAGYRLSISERAFVHHRGSASMFRLGVDGNLLLRQNEARYLDKWRIDTECGFVNVLPGLSSERTVFDESRRPEVLLASFRSAAQLADISLCMIVKDEARVIGDCLRSAEPFFKEIIVVDTGSTDGTQEIARSFGAKVYEHPWENSFSDARNRSLSYAKGSWIFWMDADDTLPMKTGEAILDAAMSAPADVSGFVIPVQFVTDGKDAGTRVDHVKLFRRGPNVRFEGRIHEQVLQSLRSGGGMISRLYAVVLHSGYDTSPEGQAKKRARDRALLWLDLTERPNHPFVLFNLGMTAHFNTQHKKACRWLKKSIEAAEPGESHLRKAYVLLAVSQRELGLSAESAWTLEEGLRAVGTDPELHFQRALLHSRCGNLQEAVHHYSAALDADVSSCFNSFDIGIKGFKTHHNLAGVLNALGRRTEAKEHYLKALSSSSDYAPSAEELFTIAMEVRDWSTAQLCLDHLNKIDGLGKLYCSHAARFAEAQGGPMERQRLFENIARTCPTALEPRLCLARACFDAGQNSRAVHVLRELEAAGEPEAAFMIGVSRMLAGDPRGAREHLLVAHRLNPFHDQTRQHVRRVNVTLGLAEEDGLA
ncbi:MAG: glycosyltransferase [Armatimonadetes bacterium]|nr:glycosyltransferase [Armatimonadota bacterium]